MTVLGRGLVFQPVLVTERERERDRQTDRQTDRKRQTERELDGSVNAPLARL